MLQQLNGLFNSIWPPTSIPLSAVSGSNAPVSGQAADEVMTKQMMVKLEKHCEKWQQCAKRNNLSTSTEKRLQEWMKYLLDFMRLAKTWTNDNGYIEDLINEQQADDWHGFSPKFYLNL